MKKMTLEKHAKLPASKAHGAGAAGFYKGGKTDADMLKMGRGLAKVKNQQTGMKKP
jgi:hypothetical protein